MARYTPFLAIRGLGAALSAAILAVALADAAPAWAQSAAAPALDDGTSLAPPDLDGRRAAAFEELLSEDEEVWRRAERRLDKLLSRSGSPSFDLLLERGEKALEAKNPDAAMEHLIALTNLAPDFSEGWRLRALAHVAKEEPGPALAALADAIAAEPRNYKAHYLLGALFEKLEQRKKAYAAYEQALKTHPNHSEARPAFERLAPKAVGRDA